MTSPITYPPGTISKWGIIQALANQLAWITYIGVDGSIFYLAGPLAPVAGAQDGLVLTKHMGLMSPFELLKLQGARQHGSTWTDTNYDEGEIMLSLEASGITPQGIRDVLRQWVSAWDPSVGNPGYPNQLGKLSVFTPDLGEWWANVRVAKNFSDIFDQDFTYSGKQKITWEVHNDDAFWYSVDSTSTFAVSYSNLLADFTTYGAGPTLGSDWHQLYSNTDAGTLGTLLGTAYWDQNGTKDTIDVANLFHTNSSTDNQVISFTLGAAKLANLFNFVDPGAAIDIWARTPSTPPSDYSSMTGVRLRFQLDTFSLSYWIGGTGSVWFTLPLVIPPVWGETFTLLAGTDNDDYEFAIQRDGITFFRYTDSAHQSEMGSSYRGWGFGEHTNDLVVSMIVPPPVDRWFADDNLAQTESGYVSLTNMGDIEAWPRYLCYGPGTFTFGNGPNSTTNVTLGPLEDGQIVLVTTEPRYKSVIDLTPNQPTPASLNKFKTLLAELISFATNNNVPPLIQKFESFFGIVPPQGNLYPLLNGRFTNPIPRAYYGKPLVTNYIPVSITNGSPNSKIVAAITPRRRWPL